MNITKLGWRGAKTTHRNIDDKSLLSLLTSESTQSQIEKFREKIRSALPGRTYKFIQRIPQLIFAGTFQATADRLLLKEYIGCVLLEIRHLKGWDEACELRDRIAAYPQTLWAFVGASGRSVKCNNPQWHDLFYRWFLGMVAYWQERDTQHANSTSPLLVGPQGIAKSTFCISILPPELQLYYTDDLDFSEKRYVMLYLNRFALISLDEFDQISVRHQGFLKHLLQKPSVNVRRPNSAYIEKVRRYASFIATSDHEDLLNDPSGSRRFICVHVSEIDNSQPIDYQQLYAQAVAALDKGERYWFTREEGVRQTESNREFQQEPVQEQLYHQYFRAAEDEAEGEWMLAVEIFQYLQKKSGIKLPVGKMSMFGRFLSRLGILSRRTRNGVYYRVVERTKKT